MGLSLLSWSTMDTCDQLVMGRMNPLVMFLYSMVQLKVIPWNRMFFWQKSIVYLPLGTARLTSRRVAKDQPANQPIFALSTICLQIFQAVVSFSLCSSSSFCIQSLSSFSSLGSSTWKRISHMQSSLPTQSEAVSTMISFLLIVELLMVSQRMERMEFFPLMVSRVREASSSPILPQFIPLNDILAANIQLNYQQQSHHPYRNKPNIIIYIQITAPLDSTYEVLVSSQRYYDTHHRPAIFGLISVFPC